MTYHRYHFRRRNSTQSKGKLRHFHQWWRLNYCIIPGSRTLYYRQFEFCLIFPFAVSSTLVQEHPLQGRIWSLILSACCTWWNCYSSSTKINPRCIMTNCSETLFYTCCCWKDHFVNKGILQLTRSWGTKRTCRLLSLIGNKPEVAVIVSVCVAKLHVCFTENMTLLSRSRLIGQMVNGCVYSIPRKSVTKDTKMRLLVLNGCPDVVAYSVPSNIVRSFQSGWLKSEKLASSYRYSGLHAKPNGDMKHFWCMM